MLESLGYFVNFARARGRHHYIQGFTFIILCFSAKIEFTLQTDLRHEQGPLENAPLKVKVKSIEGYLGAGLVRFRLQEAAQQLMRDGRSVYDDQEKSELASAVGDSAFAQQTTHTTKAFYLVHSDQTGSCVFEV
jgi:hypothetical protein